jgi:hypothetical protein
MAGCRGAEFQNCVASFGDYLAQTGGYSTLREPKWKAKQPRNVASYATQLPATVPRRFPLPNNRNVRHLPLKHAKKLRKPQTRLRLRQSALCPFGKLAACFAHGCRSGNLRARIYVPED